MRAGIASFAVLFCTACSTSGGAAPLGHSCGPVEFCSEPAEATGPDAENYRGRILPDVSIASNPTAQSAPDPPVATLTFTGGEVETTDAGCKQAASQGAASQVQIFVGSEDVSTDASGTVHVHVAPRNGYFASGPNIYANESTTPGWAVDLTVTADGWMTATLSSGQGPPSNAGPGAQRITISGPVECDGAGFFPCRQSSECR